MTYLGYQVKDLDEANEKLEAWLQVNSSPISVWGKTVVGSGCDYGTEPEVYPWANKTIYCFESLVDGCSFTTVSEYYRITICEPPSDRWGNTATYSQELSLKPGYFMLAYQDDSYAECVIGDSEFIEWVETHHPDKIGIVREETVCNGTSNSWQYVTTNVNPKDLLWQALLEDFESENPT